MPGEIKTEILLLAVTRPAMKWGVPMEGFCINVFGTFFFGMVMGAPYYWLIGVLIHFLMRGLSAFDPNFFRILRLWLNTKGGGLGTDLFGAPAIVPLSPRRATDATEFQICV